MRSILIFGISGTIAGFIQAQFPLKWSGHVPAIILIAILGVYFPAAMEVVLSRRNTFCPSMRQRSLAFVILWLGMPLALGIGAIVTIAIANVAPSGFDAHWSEAAGGCVACACWSFLLIFWVYLIEGAPRLAGYWAALLSTCSVYLISEVIYWVRWQSTGRPSGFLLPAILEQTVSGLVIGYLLQRNIRLGNRLISNRTFVDLLSLGGWPIHKMTPLLWVPHSCSFIA